MTRNRIFILALLALAVATTLIRIRGQVPRMSGPIPYQAYVWQRDWTEAVKQAVREIDPKLPTPIFLAAEITWHSDRPTVIRVPIDYATLGRKPFAVTLRIGTIDPDRIDRPFITDLAKSVIATSPYPPAELQIDFDCAESKLAGYTRLIEAIKPAVAPVPVAITALPAWLDRGEFKPLAQLGPYVLQVHSLQRPANAKGELKLIDPDAARRAVERAARIGVPFRVALPTYGSIAVFDRDGKFLRIYSENAPSLDDPSLIVKSLYADPAMLAELIRQWQADRPAAMAGVIWYRLPVATDTLNWHPLTLAAVMAGRTPAARLVVTTANKAGLVDLYVNNDGDADAPPPGRVVIEWTGDAPIAADAIDGYEKLDAQPHAVTLSRIDRTAAAGRMPPPAEPIRPGDRRAIGWLRFTQDTEVRGHVTPRP